VRLAAPQLLRGSNGCGLKDSKQGNIFASLARAEAHE
jgi:hypothetical protein